MGIRKENKKSRAVSLPQIALSLRENVKVDDVITGIANGGGIELCSAGRNAYKRLKVAMKSVCMVYHVLFQWLLEALDQSGEDISLRCELQPTG